MPIPRRFTNWFVATVLLATGLTYICDSLYISHKMSSGNSADALGSVQFFPATKLKNGKLDIYIESPQTETCVHALFPHYGYNPCWYAKRNQVHVVAQRIEPQSSAGVPAGILRAQVVPRSQLTNGSIKSAKAPESNPSAIQKFAICENLAIGKSRRDAGAA